MTTPSRPAGRHWPILRDGEEVWFSDARGGPPEPARVVERTYAGGDRLQVVLRRQDPRRSLVRVPFDSAQVWRR